MISEQLLQRAQRLGHDPTRPHVAIVGALGSVDEPADGRLYQRSLSQVAELAQSRLPRPLAAMHRGNIVTLWPVEGERGDGAAELVRRAMGAAVGGGRRDGGRVGTQAPIRYGEAYRTAKGALDIAMRAGRTNTVVQLEDLGVLGLLLQLEDATQLVAFSRRAPGPAARLRRGASNRSGRDVAHLLRAASWTEAGRPPRCTFTPTP